MTIAPHTSIGERPHRVSLMNPGPAVPDGEGGSLATWTDLNPPALSVKIAPATAADLEHVASGTVLSKATHIVKAPFHPQITTQTRLMYNGRRFSVTGVADPEERHQELVLVCVEIVQ